MEKLDEKITSINEDFYNLILRGYQEKIKKFKENKKLEYKRRIKYTNKIKELTEKYVIILINEMKNAVLQGNFSVIIHNCLEKKDFLNWNELLPSYTPTNEYSIVRLAERLIEDMIYNSETLPCFITYHIQDIEDNDYLKITLKWV